MHYVPANDVNAILSFTGGDQLIVRRKYPNAPESESELFTGDTSEW